MSQASVAKNLGPAPAAAPEMVAPFITAAVGDVARPRAVLAPAPARDLRHLPGEGGLLVGLRSAVSRTRRGVAYHLEKERQFGKVFRSQLGRLPLVYVGDREMIAQITRNDDHAWSAPLAWNALFEGVDGGSGEALDSPLMLDSGFHRDARKLLQPAFGAAATASYLAKALPHFEAAIESWVHRGKVDFKQEIRTLLARVTTSTFLGIDDAQEAAAIEQATADLWSSLLAIVKNRWISARQRRAIVARARLVSFLRRRVPERRARGGDDLFSRLCMETRDAEGLTDDSVVGLVLGILLAAFDTTACGLASMAYLLAKNPGWQERLGAEAMAVRETRITYESTRKLEDTEHAWKETLRLMPISAGVPRYALRDVDLGGWRIPAGALIVATTSTSSHDSAAWSHPDRFDPDRFSEARAEDRTSRGQFLPFGAGAHACIGMHLANVEVKAFWHAMLTRCRFRLARDYEATHTLAPMGVVSGTVTLELIP
jgi:cytochrome P450